MDYPTIKKRAASSFLALLLAASLSPSIAYAGDAADNADVIPPATSEEPHPQPPTPALEEPPAAAAPTGNEEAAPEAEEPAAPEEPAASEEKPATLAMRMASMSYSFHLGTAWVASPQLPYGTAERYTASDGRVAYCLNAGLHMPTDELSGNYVPTPQIKAAAAFGYPNVQQIGGFDLSADQAQTATQLAIWALNASGKGQTLDLGTLYSLTGGEGQKVIDATLWLYNKALAGYQDTPSTITKPADETAKPFDSSYVRFGPYTVDYTTYVDPYIVSAPAGSFVGKADGTAITPGNNQEFYIYAPVESLKSAGSVAAAVYTRYSSQAWLCWASNSHGDQDMLNTSDPDNTAASLPINLTWSTTTVDKVDGATGKPIADTEFTLAKDDGTGNYVDLYTQVTSDTGKLVFGGLGAGNYRIAETRSNPEYLTGEEGASRTDEQFFVITDASTDEVQVFENDLAQVSCEVDKSTIERTSAAFDGTGYGFANHVGKENYMYHVSGRNTSNAKADEMTIGDNCEFTQYGLRIQWLVTGVGYGDFDGRATLVYQTNKNDKSAPTVLSKPVLSAGFDNPNNPSGKLVDSARPGWIEWANIDVTAPQRLEVADLGLADDEYITGWEIWFGDVDKGMAYGENYAATPADQFYNAAYAGMTGRDVIYGVAATRPLGRYVEGGNTELVIPNSAYSTIYRNNGVLSDRDDDLVETRLVDSFKTTFNYFNGRTGGLASTGDASLLPLACLIALAAISAGAAAFSKRREVCSKDSRDRNE